MDIIKMTTKRVKTGIQGLDKLMQGGYPEKSVILISGGPGTAKTTFALQYIYQGAKNNEPGVYVSFEQEPEQLKETMKDFEMDLSKLEKEKKIALLRIKNANDITDVLELIEKNVKKLNAKRLVIDSLSSVEIFASTFRSMIKDLPTGLVEKRYGFYPPTKTIIRRLMYKMMDYFKELGVTTLLISESQNSEYSRYGIAEFVTDGLINMQYLGIGSKNFRSMKIIKMRQTKHEEDFIPFEIGKQGVGVRKIEKFKA